MVLAVLVAVEVSPRAAEAAAVVLLAVRREVRRSSWYVTTQASSSSCGEDLSINKRSQEPHRHEGVFVVRGKEDAIATRNIVPGESVYGEKRVSVDNQTQNEDGTTTTTKIEYRVWNPFRSKLAAAVIGGLEKLYFGPGSKVLYLGGASGTSVSHVADIVGPTGFVYAVEFSPRSGRDLIGMAAKRTNVVPIVEDARQPLKYRMLMPMVDCIFADVAQPDQARIVAMNAHQFLKVGGGILISIKANCIDSTAPAHKVFAMEVEKLRAERITPKEQLTLGW